MIYHYLFIQNDTTNNPIKIYEVEAYTLIEALKYLYNEKSIPLDIILDSSEKIRFHLDGRDMYSDTIDHDMEYILYDNEWLDENHFLAILNDPDAKYLSTIGKCVMYQLNRNNENGPLISYWTKNLTP